LQVKRGVGLSHNWTRPKVGGLRRTVRGWVSWIGSGLPRGGKPWVPSAGLLGKKGGKKNNQGGTQPNPITKRKVHGLNRHRVSVERGKRPQYRKQEFLHLDGPTNSGRKGMTGFQGLGKVTEGKPQGRFYGESGSLKTDRRGAKKPTKGQVRESGLCEFSKGEATGQGQDYKRTIGTRTWENQDIPKSTPAKKKLEKKGRTSQGVPPRRKAKARWDEPNKP